MSDKKKRDKPHRSRISNIYLLSAMVFFLVWKIPRQWLLLLWCWWWWFLWFDWLFWQFSTILIRKWIDEIKYYNLRWLRTTPTTTNYTQQHCTWLVCLFVPHRHQINKHINLNASLRGRNIYLEFWLASCTQMLTLTYETKYLSEFNILSMHQMCALWCKL